jgi:hypothetical protein
MTRMDRCSKDVHLGMGAVFIPYVYVAMFIPYVYVAMRLGCLYSDTACGFGDSGGHVEASDITTTKKTSEKSKYTKPNPNGTYHH